MMVHFEDAINFVDDVINELAGDTSGEAAGDQKPEPAKEELSRTHSRLSADQALMNAMSSKSKSFSLRCSIAENASRPLSERFAEMDLYYARLLRLRLTDTNEVPFVSAALAVLRRVVVGTTDFRTNEGKERLWEVEEFERKVAQLCDVNSTIARMKANEQRHERQMRYMLGRYIVMQDLLTLEEQVAAAKIQARFKVLVKNRRQSLLEDPTGMKINRAAG